MGIQIFGRGEQNKNTRDIIEYCGFFFELFQIETAFQKNV
jgi:hypothetical protein